MNRYVMGIDNGGTVTKAAIYDLNGKEIAITSKHTKMITPRPFQTERDIEELWLANLYVIKETLKKSKINADDLVGISVTGHGNGLYLVDHAGHGVRNGIVSTDSRAKSYIDRWYQDPDFEKYILPRTMQSMWAGQPVALLAWLQDNEPQVIDQTAYLFMVKDLIRYKLTGEAYFELTDASGTNLINVKKGKYDDVLLNFFGIQAWKDKLPPLKGSTEVCGRITKEVAQLTGLKKGTPVSGGIFDISASALASGLVNEDQLGIITGTWSINEYITKTPVIDKELFMTSIYPINGEWLTTEASPTSGSNLEWFINTFMAKQKETYEQSGQSIYELCNQLVNATKPEESDLLFFPFIFGSNTISDATAGFVGATSYHELKHFLRAVYEGVVFSHFYHIERLKGFNKNLKGPARIAGGITNSDVWMQIFADTLQMPMEIVDVKEHGTLGAALSASIMSKDYQTIKEAAQAMVKISKVVNPIPANKEVYAKKYAYYKKVLLKMADPWEVTI